MAISHQDLPGRPQEQAKRNWREKFKETFCYFKFISLSFVFSYLTVVGNSSFIKNLMTFSTIIIRLLLQCIKEQWITHSDSWVTWLIPSNVPTLTQLPRKRKIMKCWRIFLLTVGSYIHHKSLTTTEFIRSSNSIKENHKIEKTVRKLGATS